MTSSGPRDAGTDAGINVDVGTDAIVDAGDPVRQWSCPAGWAAFARGGCAPLVITCRGSGASDPRCRDLSAFATWPTPEQPPRAGIGACPEGWRALDDRTCDPALPTTCAVGGSPLPGGRCTATSETECPTGAFAAPSDLPAGTIPVRVRDGATSVGADGSEDHPYPTLTAALAGRTGERWVLIASGTYRESLVIDAATHLIGACAARVTLEATAAGATPTLTVSAALDLRGVTVAGSSPGVNASAGGSVTIARSVIASSRGYGLRVRGTGTSGMVHDAVVRGVDPDSGSAAVEVSGGGRLELRRTAITGNRGRGVLASNGALTLEDSVVASTSGSSAGVAGSGLVASQGGTITARRVLIDRNIENAAVALSGATLDLEDCVARRTRGFANGTQGLGLVATGRSTIRAVRVLVEDNRQTGVIADGEGCEATLDACVIRRTAARRDGTNGGGLGALNGARVTATATLIDANHDLGAIAYQNRSSLALTECEVRGTLPRSDGTQGIGVAAHTGAIVTVNRTLITGNRNVGLLAFAAGASVVVRDTMVRDTLHPEGAGPGASLVALLGATVDADHVAVSNNIDAALEASGRASIMTVRDVVVAPFDDQPRPRGVGVLASQGGVINGERIGVDDVDGAGVAANSGLVDEERGSAVRISDLFVRGITPRVVSMDGAPIAYALSLYDAVVEMDRAVVIGGEYGFVVEQGQFTLRSGVVLDATRSVGVVNASPEPSLADVTLASPGQGVVRDMTVGRVRIAPPPPPSL